MKKLIKFGLTALCVATMTACGGSGGGSSNNAPAPSKQTKTVNGGGTPTSGRAVGSITAKNVAAGTIKTATVSNTAVIVDGKTFSLAPFGGASRNLGVFANNMEVVKKTDDGQYYGFVSEGRGKQRYAYYGSLEAETAVMPTAGIVHYDGDVVYSYGGRIEPNEQYADGDVKLTVDFGTKKINGTIDDAIGGSGVKGLAQVNADISGSSFAGKVSTATVSSDLSGKFFGVNARSMAGVFTDPNNTLSGAFEADRD